MVGCKMSVTNDQLLFWFLFNFKTRFYVEKPGQQQEQVNARESSLFAQEIPYGKIVTPLLRLSEFTGSLALRFDGIV